MDITKKRKAKTLKSPKIIKKEKLTEVKKDKSTEMKKTKKAPKIIKDEQVIAIKKTKKAPKIIQEEPAVEIKKAKKAPKIIQEELTGKKKLKKVPKTVEKEQPGGIEKTEKAVPTPDEKNSTFFMKNNLTENLLRSYVEALHKVVQSDNEDKKSLFDSEELPILLNVTCFKVPKIPTHQLRIFMPHSYIAPGDDVALIVSDLRRGRRIDYEPTVEHYKEILKNQNCTQITDIIPFNRLKTEYGPFELKRKLFNSFDCFLVDGKISGHVAHFLGKKFSDKRKLPISIRMESKCLKREIDDALRKTSMKLHGFGDTYVVQIGTMKMDVDQVVENLRAVCLKLEKDFPGGWENVRSLWIKTTDSMTIPVFMSLKSKNKVPVPVIEPKRPRQYRTYEGELSTVGKNVVVTPEGGVIMEDGSDSEISDDEEFDAEVSDAEVSDEDDLEL